jgi:GNAT superfamily N-acetyltransferase
MSYHPDTAPGITLRPESAEDEPLLFELYAETRAAELDGVGWDPAMRRSFLTMQFKAQRQGYRTMFPEAAFSIIITDDRPAGRIVVNRTEGEIRLVDLVLLPPYRGRGIGTQLLTGLCAQAVEGKKALRLHALKGSRARRLYERLGFRKVDETGVYDQMEWRAKE